jgi:hypothetical protein
VERVEEAVFYDGARYLCKSDFMDFLEQAKGSD